MLAVLVVKDGADWLKRSLAALARQSYDRLGVLAVDNASTDGSGELLTELLGPRRVMTLPKNEGFPAAVARVMETPVAREADFLLLLHDDTVLHPDAVACLVAAAGDGVGVVGPKVLDGERRVLREIGYTIDRFGYRYSALEEGEIDQGQHDSPREVLYVSGAAMLVARDAWLRAGPPDRRLRPSHGDLDFCWRVRIAGFRVVMDPSAVAYHEAVGDAGRRAGARAKHVRYLEERSALTAMLKNYRLATLLWVMPMYVLQGLAKMVLFVASRRFGAARQVLAAWGWTLLRFPGTLARRARLHAVRAVREREVTATMAPTSARLRRWAGQASAFLFPDERAGELSPEEEIATVPLRERVGGFLGRYPALVALGFGLALTLVSFRGVLFASPLQGGALPTFPASARALLAAYIDGSVPAGFGGAEAASPALVPLGLASILTLGNPRTLAWLLVAVTPLLAGASAYRSVVRRTGSRVAAVLAGGSYALSAVVLWAVSEGRVAEMVFLIGLPWVQGRIADPFERPVGSPMRWALGTAVVLAITGSFFPAAWAPVAISTAVTLLVGGARGRRLAGTGIALATLLLAGVLVFPFLLTLARVGVGRGAELGIATEFGSILRLSPGEAPGSWAFALFLPVAGVLGFALASQRAAAWRAILSAAAGLLLAWLAAAGHLPSPAAEPIAYLGLAAFALSGLIGLGVASVASEGARPAFGGTQLAFGLMVLVVATGVLFQAGQAVRGAWAVGEDRISPAYPVVTSADRGWAFRVLWLGRVGGGSFPPPGGPAEGVVEARRASVRYAITGRTGRSVLSVGLPPGGAAYEELEVSLRAMLAGRVRHGGSLLAPFAVAYVVAGEDDLPGAARERLDAQLDLIPGGEAGGLVLYRNTRALPMAGVLPAAPPDGDVRAQDLLAPARVPRLGVEPFRRLEPEVWGGSPTLAEPGTAIVSNAYDPAWTLRTSSGRELEPFRAFGWAVGFEAPPGGGEMTLVRPDDSWRTPEVAGLAVVWIGALWILRRRA